MGKLFTWDGEAWQEVTGAIGPRGPQGESIVGPKGDKGDKGDDGLSIMGPPGPSGTDGTAATVYHGADANYTRPDTGNPIIWVGSVEPVNALDNDVWLQTS